jgi:hypothetical protein
MMSTSYRLFFRDRRGQSLMEFALAIPLLLLLALGVVEFGYALLDKQIVTKATREGSNLISRDATLQDAATAMSHMSTAPVDFLSNSKLIFSVLKRGETVGTANYDKLILYQRHEIGAIAGASKLNTVGAGAFGGAPDYKAVNSDNNVNLQITNAPNGLVATPGGLVYVTEVYSNHTLLTPFDKFGLLLPQQFYSIAYF